jgi:hypothetical protein
MMQKLSKLTQTAQKFKLTRTEKLELRKSLEFITSMVDKARGSKRKSKRKNRKVETAGPFFV